MKKLLTILTVMCVVITCYADRKTGNEKDVGLKVVNNLLSRKYMLYRKEAYIMPKPVLLWERCGMLSIHKIKNLQAE